MAPDIQGKTRTALILGITGGIGGAVAQALHRRGWALRALHRNPYRAAPSAGLPPGIEWIAGDAMRADEVSAAAAGAALIFHGVNPPGYRNWPGLAIPMLGSAIAAARLSGARLLFPGNVYNFGPDAGALASETSPQHPTTRKGAVRVRMEDMLREAAAAGVRSLVLRAGDFFGGHGKSSWFGSALVKPGAPLRSVTYPGVHQAGHAWAYLPDLTETFARLADIEASLADFEVVHFGGHWFEHGVEMAEAIRRAAGKPDIPIRALPWPLLYVGAPFVTFMREMIEMRYLWQRPLRLDNRKLVGLLGEEPHTPLEQALRASLAELGCLLGQEGPMPMEPARH
jgi:nucleoside-diphosphate-sugar epimerase